jgi:hypothetical protein
MPVEGISGPEVHHFRNDHDDRLFSDAAVLLLNTDIRPVESEHEIARESESESAKNNERGASVAPQLPETLPRSRSLQIAPLRRANPDLPLLACLFPNQPIPSPSNRRQKNRN